jgi:ParB family chromosome partitioning protein
MDSTVRQVPLAQIDPSPYQPRRTFDEQALRELAESIARHGLQQPIVVRRAGARFQLIAGERRWRAARLAGLTEIPATVTEMSDQQAQEFALVENIVRSDLSTYDEAMACARMRQEGRAVAEIATALSKKRGWVKARLRLLDLRPEYLDALRLGILTTLQAAELSRVPRERQPAVMRRIHQGLDGPALRRVVRSLIADHAQIEMPGVREQRAAVDRIGKLLDGLAAQLGRCYSKTDLELLGWVTSAPTERHLQIAGLLIRQLRSIEDALKKARARRALREGAVQ